MTNYTKPDTITIDCSNCRNHHTDIAPPMPLTGLTITRPGHTPDAYDLPGTRAYNPHLELDDHTGPTTNTDAHLVDLTYGIAHALLITTFCDITDDLDTALTRNGSLTYNEPEMMSPPVQRADHTAILQLHHMPLELTETPRALHGATIDLWRHVKPYCAPDTPDTYTHVIAWNITTAETIIYPNGHGETEGLHLTIGAPAASHPGLPYLASRYAPHGDTVDYLQLDFGPPTDNRT